MKNKKISLYIIIILLVFFLPSTIAGTIYKLKNKKDENEQYLFSYKGYLWFYDDNNNLISKYECKTENCGLAKITIDDSDYDFHYYEKEDINLEVSKDINGYTFINDGEEVLLYVINSGTILQTYKEIKDYDVIIGDGDFIIKDTNDTWGLLRIGASLGVIVPFGHDFIGISHNNYENDVLKTDRILVYRDSFYFIVDNTYTTISGLYRNPIIDYNDKYVFVKENNRIKAYDYNDQEYLRDYNISDILMKNEYVGIISNKMLYIYTDLSESAIRSFDLANVTGKLKLDINNNMLEILENDVPIETLELS